MAGGVRGPQRLIPALVALLALSCPAAAQSESSAAREVVDAVLERHHGPLRGTFQTAILELRPSPDAAPDRLVIARSRMRIDCADGTVLLLVDGTGWRCPRGQSAERLEGEDLEALQRRHAVARAVLLRPLAAATVVRPKGGGVYELVLEGGETWRLVLDPKDHSPLRLSGDGVEVDFLRWLDTGLTRLPARIDIGALGTRAVRFIASDLVLDDSVFEDPQRVVAQAARPRQGAITRALRSPGDLPAEPEVQVVRAQMLLVVEGPGDWDPGDWAGRARALAAAAQRLAAQGQTGDGLPVYQRVAQGYRILLPFRPDPRGGGRPFVRGEGQEIVHTIPHRAVVVAPPPSSWEAAMKAGRAQIERLLRTEELTKAGPLRVIPFVSPQDPPSPAEAERLRLRLEQPVR